jgi:hypothetical protein
MAVDFSKIDEAVDLQGLQKDVEDSKNNFSDVPKGTYIVSIEKMEIGETKDHRPMFKMQCKIKEGEFKNRNLFMNRVIYGTKNDGSMIQSVLTLLEKLQTVTVPEFTGYNAFVDNVLDIYEEIQGKVELEVEYDADAFNSISIKEVYDL